MSVWHHQSSHLHILHIFQTKISPELMQIFANSKQHFHSFIEFFVIHLKYQEVKIWSWWHFNPLTPVPPVTTRDEPWPFFLFWRHHFWPKLASSILNFCRRKRSFQWWCPDQSDQPNGALDTHKNAQKVEWKTQSKISCHYTWLLHAKNCPSRWRFLRSFFNRKQAQ